MKSSEAEVRKTLKYLQHLGLLPKTSHKVSKVCVFEGRGFTSGLIFTLSKHSRKIVYHIKVNLLKIKHEINNNWIGPLICKIINMAG